MNPDYFAVGEARSAAASAVPVASGVATNIQEAKWTLVPENVAEYDETLDDDDEDLEPIVAPSPSLAVQVISQQPLARSTVSPVNKALPEANAKTPALLAGSLLSTSTSTPTKAAKPKPGSGTTLGARPGVGPSLVALLDQLHGDFLVLARRNHFDKQRTLAAKRSQSTSAAAASSSSSSSPSKQAARLLLESRREGLRQTLDSGRHGSTDLGDPNEDNGSMPRMLFHLDPPSSFHASPSGNDTKHVEAVDTEATASAAANANAAAAGAPMPAASNAAAYATSEPFVPRIVSDGHRLDWASVQALLEPARLMALAANPHLPPGKVAAKFDFAVTNVFRAFKVRKDNTKQNLLTFGIDSITCELPRYFRCAMFCLEYRGPARS